MVHFIIFICHGESSCLSPCLAELNVMGIYFLTLTSVLAFSLRLLLIIIIEVSIFVIIITGTKLKNCSNAQILLILRDIKRSRNSAYFITTVYLRKTTKTRKSIRLRKARRACKTLEHVM